MNPAPDFEIVDGIAVYRPVAACPLPQAVDMIASAIARARSDGHRQMMIVTTGLSGFASPSVFERLELVRRWAEAAQGLVTLCVVARTELIDPERFGVVLATSFGLPAHVVESEAEGLQWLRALQAGAAR